LLASMVLLSSRFTPVSEAEPTCSYMLITATLYQQAALDSTAATLCVGLHFSTTALPC
jgi:hypothetical protein